MSAQLTWYGHGTWGLATGGKQILIDPFLNDSPSAPVRADTLACDYLLISHGHYDHVADAVSIALRTGATVVSNFEICAWVAKQGVEHTEPMNIGGAINLPFGKVKSTPAWHSSSLPDGSYGGTAGGFLLQLPERNIYFACDTSLFLDMQLIGAYGLDVAVLPIGDRYTMGPADALEATRLLKPKRVIPSHFDTWPPIEQDAETWAQQIRSQTSAEPVLLEPGVAWKLT